MKLSKGKANPGLLNKILLKKLNAKSWCFCWWVSISIYILSQENEKCMQLCYSWHNSCQLPSLKLVSPWVGSALTWGKPVLSQWCDFADDGTPMNFTDEFYIHFTDGRSFTSELMILPSNLQFLPVLQETWSGIAWKRLGACFSLIHSFVTWLAFHSRIDS